MWECKNDYIYFVSLKNDSNGLGPYNKIYLNRVGDDTKSPLFSLIELDCARPINETLTDYSFTVKHFPSSFMCNK